MNSKALYPFAFAAAALFVASTPVRASDTDDKIESSFQQSHVYQTYLKDDAIKTEAEKGFVTLTGTVGAESHKALAEDTVASLPGVKSVDNQLATTAEAKAEGVDESIARKVNFALLFHRHVSAGKTDVAVKEGNVTLTGEADSLAQKELTGSYAADIEGVKAVQNDLTIAAAPEAAERSAGEKMDDASITAQVKSALRAHRSTSALETKIATRDGAVTVTGIARNAAEKALVTKMINDIKGVTSVQNEMTIQVAMAK